MNYKDLNYKSKLSLMDTQIAIKFVKDSFEDELVESLKLHRVTAPLFVLSKTGLNDNLNGVERPVTFNVPAIDGDAEIVHSLAKWKRMALGKYNFDIHTGLYTDMNAIRRDENLDFIHSLYVDQWDWEIAIAKEDRSFEYLKHIVSKIYDAIYNLSRNVEAKYPILKHNLPEEIHFISTTLLEEMYPELSSKERENAITKKYGAVFLYQIGLKLPSGNVHDGRAADYDDWLLNGDILLYYDLYDMALEISSMGIRVNDERLIYQLSAKNELYKLENEYCKAIINHKIPLSIGGGIGQSRLCMFMLKKAHIGEVQVSLWNEEDIKDLKKYNIELL